MEKDKKNTKSQFTNESAKLRLRIIELEKSEAEHKRAQEKFSEASARLQMFQQITAVVHSTLDIEKVFRQITDGFVHSMGYTTAIIMGLDNEGKCFEVKAFSTEKRLSSQIDKILGFPIKRLSFPADPESAPILKSLERGRMVVAKTLIEIAYPMISRKVCIILQQLGKTKKYIVVPLRTKEGIVGGVFITSPRDLVSEEELKMVKIFARSAAHAIKNANLHMQTKRAEEALRESERKYRDIIENLNEVVFRLSIPDGKYDYISPAVKDIFGYSRKEFLNTPMLIAKIVHPDFVDEFKQNWADIIEGKVVPTYEYKVIDSKGNAKWILQSNKGIFDNKGNIIALEGIARDITERKQAEGDIKKAMGKLQTTLEKTVNALAAAVGKRDPYTASHQQRVTKLAIAIAEEMGFSKEQVQGIRIAGLLHDVGKISVPAEILGKPAKLTPAEFEIVKSHSQAGYDILKSIEFPWPVAEIVLQHHERINGLGYPQGFLDKDILIEAKILGVADVVEAMCSHRPYRSALGVAKTLKHILQNKGSLFDPEVVDVCVRLFKEKGFRFE